MTFQEVYKKVTDISYDKLLHNFYGSLIFSVCLPLFGSLVALLVVAVVAIAKEVYDYVSKKGHPELLDVLYTVCIPVILTLGEML